jgi:hypothetical protein
VSNLLVIRVSRFVVVMVLIGASAGAQAPQSGMGREDTGAPPLARVATPFEQFTSRLKLDARTQVPPVEQIFTEAQREAAPIAQKMLELRQQLVNVALGIKPDDQKTVVEAYAAEAARMTAIEARAFAKVHALLKPDQQARAPQAFAIMAGIFQPAGGGRGRGERGGQRGGGER